MTKRGVSPRIVSAEVVGTKGSAPVTGPQLQGIFGLPSTPAAVTTVTSAAGAPPIATKRVLVRDGLAAAETGFEVLEINGRVFPPRQGSSAAIQLQTARGWRTVTHVRPAATGSFVAWLPQAGNYRAVYAGVAGPVVAIH